MCRNSCDIVIDADSLTVFLHTRRCSSQKEDEGRSNVTLENRKITGVETALCVCVWIYVFMYRHITSMCVYIHMDGCIARRVSVMLINNK